MGVMRCNRCSRQVDLDWHLEDWDADSEQCVWCADAEEELQQQAAMAAEESE